jgi:hypothetical protein
MLPEAGTDGQDSSEAAADAEVKGGVVTFYGKLVRQETTDIASVRVKIKIYVLCQPMVLYEKRVAAVLRRTTMRLHYEGRMDALALDAACDYVDMNWSRRSGNSGECSPRINGRGVVYGSTEEEERPYSRLNDGCH